MPTRTWLARYVDGERELVRHELRQLGDRVREPGLRQDAQAVCDEIAHRARRNIETIVERLSDQGYRFHTNDFEQRPVEPLAGPIEDASEFLEWLEQTFGPVPLIVSSWITIVGDVWLVGTHPDWGTSGAADPLVVEMSGSRYPSDDMRAFLLDEYEQWVDDPQDRPFRLSVAPDRLTKDNVSGGEPYGIVVPDACADADFVTDAPGSFVSYLQRVFASGGFPHRTGDPEQGPVTRALAAGLAEL